MIKLKTSNKEHRFKIKIDKTTYSISQFRARYDFSKNKLSLYP